jgi:hypothetical protein
MWDKCFGVISIVLLSQAFLPVLAQDVGSIQAVSDLARKGEHHAAAEAAPAYSNMSCIPYETLWLMQHMLK